MSVDCGPMTTIEGSQLGGYEDWLRAAGAAPGTLRLRRHYLLRLADTYAPQRLTELSPDQLAAYLATDGWKPETRKSARASIRSFYRWALDTEAIDRDPSRTLPVVRIPAGRPRPTPDVVFAAALQAAPSRERLMILLGGLAGLRRCEIAQIHTDHIIGDELRVVGKGGRVRLVPLHPRIVAELEHVPDGWLFPSRRAGGGCLSANYVGYVMKQALGPGWSAHTLRHRFATRAYSGERDLLAVQQLLGHSKPETTQRYTQVPDGALRAAVLAAG